MMLCQKDYPACRLAQYGLEAYIYGGFGDA